MTQPNQPSYVSTVSRSMASIDREAWNALALPRPSPFLEWEWLDLLERSGSVRPENGWLPLHMTLSREGRIMAAAPFYLKSHSEGEFVFDHVFAGAARDMGERYYPKLVAAAPFTPAEGYELLLAPGLDEELGTRLVAESVRRLVRTAEASGVHVLFAAPWLAGQLAKLGYEAWTHQGFIWENEGYERFEDFLSALRAPRRKTIKRERAAIKAAGVAVRVIEGPDIPDRYFPLMHALYEKTNDKFGPYSCKYLTPAFFEGLSGDLRRRVLMSAAFVDGREDPVALALLVKKGDLLFGRYWGGFVDIPFLHFELCYYAPIAYAIESGIRLYDPGMGGEHKARRGFKSRPVVSLHDIALPGVRLLFHRHIEEINRLEMEYVDEMNSMSPFRRKDDS